MKKLLTLAALYSSTLATDVTIVEEKQHGRDILKGFLQGSNLKEQKNTMCFEGSLNIFAQHADISVKDYNMGQFINMLDAIKDISVMVDMIRKAEQYCFTAMDIDWETLDQMSLAWDAPVTFSYKPNKEIFINGKNVYWLISSAIDAHQKKDMEGFGKFIGQASVQILEGRRYLKKDVPQLHQKKPTNDPKTLYNLKKSSEYVSGFLFGAGVGGYDEKEIYECLKKEPRAEEIFNNANKRLALAVANQDGDMAVGGLIEMVMFMIDMGLEMRSAKQQNGKKLCEHFKDVHDQRPNRDTREKKMAEAKMIMQEMNDKQTRFSFDKDSGSFSFNSQDVTKDVNQMQNAYINGDFKMLGYMFGAAIDKHVAKPKKADYPGAKAVAKYIGCFKDSDQRDMKFVLGWDIDPTTCFERVAKNGNKYASLQNGAECHGDDRYGGLGQVDDSECNQKCKHDDSMTCGAGWRNAVYDISEVALPEPDTAIPKNTNGSKKAMTGTNLGGWFVLEPWISPSLFYRFLDKTQHDIGMDSYTLCQALGPVEGNKLMRAHWDSFYTEDHFKQLADRGVEIVRLPIGDWSLQPYGPYVGCMDGAAEKIDWAFDICSKYNIKILLDVHAWKDSQNGFDNSGMTTNVIWKDKSHFSHWPNEEAHWMGKWNQKDGKYDSISQENLDRAVEISRSFLQKWGYYEAFAAYEPVNEPWWNSPIDELKNFYRKVRKLVQEITPDAYFVFHDSFRYDPDLWNDLFDDNDIDKVAIDHHQYQGWVNGKFTAQEFCDDYEFNAKTADKIKYEVWIGEWSLATDVCAHWLGGFNDGNTDPQFKCHKVDCPKTYLPDSVAVDFNRKTKDYMGPFGTGKPEDVAIKQGKCNNDSAYFTTGEVRKIAKCALQAFDRHVAATFFWTAHNEIEEKWDYIKAWDLGWIDK